LSAQANVEAAGFDTFVQTSINVDVDGDGTAQINAELHPGKIGETVTVTGEAALLKTERSNSCRDVVVVVKCDVLVGFDLIAAENSRGHAEALEADATILVVDDEQMLRQTAKTMLERYGYTVVLTEGGKEGLDLFRLLADKSGAGHAGPKKGAYRAAQARGTRTRLDVATVKAICRTRTGA
jgi:hypothetical protein